MARSPAAELVICLLIQKSKSWTRRAVCCRLDAPGGIRTGAPPLSFFPHLFDVHRRGHRHSSRCLTTLPHLISRHRAYPP
ncbi:hypothetical protein FIBSPDRAFT_162463 [Athelia psychrophila]|uniref:Uncharacterized protein n=1 Tax=Athelia psychrophila TaxID=1759441 RepID=A0A166SX04_9AGAM|nr:hypothetical protein FIBSPDRAFT_162463 [Fibularhizoctonia sp. CBS 109695]